MNWQTASTTNKPDFDHPVFLAKEEIDENGKVKFSVAVGVLKSINSKGLNWEVQGDNNIFNNFGFNIPSDNDNKFQPTHWCEIELPKKNII